ncbi:MAG: ferritin-like domain-containing protein [Pirellulales bacterium]
MTTAAKSGHTAAKKRSSASRPAPKSPVGTLGEVVSGAVKKVQEALPAVGRFLTGEIDVEFQSLHDLFVKELQDLHSAERQLLDALPTMSEAAHSKSLKRAFELHRRETEEHVDRLRVIFDELELDPESKKCHAMSGLIAEADEWNRQSAAPGVKDAGLIAAAQRVEHYEMAGYGCVRTYAQLLGHRRIAQILQMTLDEEGAADKKLTRLAKRINVRAERRRTSSRRRTAK